MSTCARVTIDPSDIAALEDAGNAFQREKDEERAVRLWALALRFRHESGLKVGDARPKNREQAFRVFEGGAA